MEQTFLTAQVRVAISDEVLESYFTDGPYRFQMHFGHGTFREFYGASRQRREILEERREWLKHDPAKYLAILLEAEPIITEACELGLREGTLPPDPPPGRDAKARFLAENWEPDYLLLSREPGNIRLVGGCVCFPSSWALETKIGHRIEEIHGIVPTLNESIGRQIHTFLERLKPDSAWTRSNWGLTRSAERNQHPLRKLPRLDGGVSLDEVFFRVEEQSLLALPQTNGILFGIRIKTFPLREFGGRAVAEKLRAAIETMPESIAEYKGVTPARGRILKLLGESEKQ